MVSDILRYRQTDTHTHTEERRLWEGRWVAGLRVNRDEMRYTYEAAKGVPAKDFAKC